MSRELTREEKAAIRALVVKWCANYDREYGCLPLDCECYMLGKCWTSAYCRYFREAVLPLNPALEAIRGRMEEAGIRNMSAYIRKMALNGYILHVDLSPVQKLDILNFFLLAKKGFALFQKTNKSPSISPFGHRIHLLRK